MGYKKITEKFYSLGYVNEAKKALKLALELSPKKFSNVKHSGYVEESDYENPELIRYCQKLFDRKK